MGLFGNRAKKKEMELQVQDKLREEALNRALLNSRAPNPDIKSMADRPFEVSYNASAQSSTWQGEDRVSQPGYIMLQIEEKNELSSRKYMLDPSYPITVGTARENNIMISEPTSDVRQCEFMQYQGKVYVRNIGASHRIVLSRKKNRVFVEGQRIELKSGDTVQIGKTALCVTIIKSMAK